MSPLNPTPAQRAHHLPFTLCGRAGPEPDEASTLDREMVGNGTDVALLLFGETLISTTEVRETRGRAVCALPRRRLSGRPLTT